MQRATVIIDPELRALFKSRQARSARSGLVAAEPRQTPAVSREVPAHGVAPRRQPATVLRLRRDGARPLRFAGAVVANGSLAVPTAKEAVSTVLVRFVLYLGVDGRVVAEAATDVPADARLRPVHRASAVETAADLDAFLAAFAPERGWSWLDVDPTAEERSSRAVLAERLRAGLAHLVQAVLGCTAQPLPAGEPR